MAEGVSKKRKVENEKRENDKKPVKKFAGHWSQGLLDTMNDPEFIVESDDKMTIIKDKYPKAKYHFLVMPKETIPNLKSLKSDHLDLLKHFEEKGRALAKKTDAKVKFRFGYHSVPSMSHLHMHVISQDFNSPCLKTKKHWNSFTSEYFVDSEEIIKMLEKDGKVHFDVKDSQSLLNQDLRCHVCKKAQKNMPTLKDHIKMHDYSVD
ncbi:aprataxin-like [Mercenaria mercenaria]|uniref:aprataxin-like n=1 Tax=Mercenaria mercenaria TaxID=6596 RepID=UPI00234F006D|nr:aprataxin-like [Mercenaria mercenaria]